MLLVLLPVASCGPAGPAATTFECHSRMVGINFWPKGHPAIPSINAPETKEPHVEVGVEHAEGLYFDAKGEFHQGLPARCDESSVGHREGTMEGETEVLTATHLTCVLDTDGVISRSAPGEEPVKVIVTAGDTSVAQVILAPVDSVLTFRGDTCTTSAPPS